MSTQHQLHRAVVVARDVVKDERHNFMGRDVAAGEVLYLYDGPTYGCIDTWGGIAVTEVRGKTPFYEFPYDALDFPEEES